MYNVSTFISSYENRHESVVKKIYNNINTTYAEMIYIIHVTADGPYAQH